MTSHQILINGALVPAGEAKLHVSDLAIQRGYAVFDAFRVLDSRPIFVRDHIQRFLYSIKRLRLETDIDESSLNTYIREVITANRAIDCGIKIFMTGGYSSDAYSITKGNLIIIPFNLPSPATQISDSIRLLLFGYRRDMPDIKTTNYIHPIFMNHYLGQERSDDLLYHCKGSISECPRANVFIVGNNFIATPDQDVLSGITRKQILKLDIPGYRFEEREIKVDEIFQASEMFVSSTTKLVTPVRSVNDRLIGGGSTGPVTIEIRKKLLQLIQQ